MDKIEYKSLWKNHPAQPPQEALEEGELLVTQARLAREDELALDDGLERLVKYNMKSQKYYKQDRKNPLSMDKSDRRK